MNPLFGNILSGFGFVELCLLLGLGVLIFWPVLRRTMRGLRDLDDEDDQHSPPYGF
jgi:hypothetical protein